MTLLHGGPASPWSLSPLARALALRGALVYYPRYAALGTGDLRGGFAHVAAGMPETPGVIIAHSLGGRLALRLAEAGLPCRAIVGLGAAWRGVVDAPIVRSLRQARGPLAVPRTDVPIVSVISSSDSVVPRWTSRLGVVVEVEGISHRKLPHQTGLVLEILRRLDA